jgi:hypothetical protein
MRDASIWIGYDSRWPLPFAVCRHSLMRRMSDHIPIGAVHLDQCQARGMYPRALERRLSPAPESNFVQLWDPISEAPMATEFSISRFLTPFLAGWKGWAIFMDCDFLALRNPRALLRELDPRYALMCVKHKHDPAGDTKMDGQEQTRYFRKNWSSLMAFNCEHEANQELTLDMVNELPGRDLHRFCWLQDEHIGALSPEWNWIEGVTDPQVAPSFVHYSEGGPWLDAYGDCAFSREWISERDIWIAGDMDL